MTIPMDETPPSPALMAAAMDVVAAALSWRTNHPSPSDSSSGAVLAAKVDDYLAEVKLFLTFADQVLGGQRDDE